VIPEMSRSHAGSVTSPVPPTEEQQQHMLHMRSVALHDGLAATGGALPPDAAAMAGSAAIAAAGGMSAPASPPGEASNPTAAAPMAGDGNSDGAGNGELSTHANCSPPPLHPRGGGSPLQQLPPMTPSRQNGTPAASIFSTPVLLPPAAATATGHVVTPRGISNSSSNSATASPTAAFLRPSGLARSITTPESAIGSSSSGNGVGANIVGGGVLYGTNISAGRVTLIGNASLSRPLQHQLTMGPRQPSAPTTPAMSPQRRATLTLGGRGGGYGGGAMGSMASFSAHTSPMNGAGTGAGNNNHHRASMLSLPSSGSRGAGGGGSASRLRRPSISLLSTADELPDTQAVLARAHSSGAARGSTAATAAGASTNATSRSSVISPTPDLTCDNSSGQLVPAAAGSVSSALQSTSGGALMIPHHPQLFARPDAMISYSRKDISFVRLLYQHFENAGRNVWIGLTTMHFAARRRMSARRSGGAISSFSTVVFLV
jgi:hypothetical protein